jgi:imidazolonepropionase-like amidohydrolase
MLPTISFRLMSILKIVITVFFFQKVLLTTQLFANDQIPAPPQQHPIALVNGIVHSFENGVLEGTTVLFENGKITFIGGEKALPENTEVIDVTGKHVYPAFIAMNTVLGLTEINAVRATRDFQEVGDFTPEVRAEVAYNPDSELLPVTRANGVAITQTVPQSGLISGTSAVMMLDGWTWESMTVKAPAGLHIFWPRMKVVERPWIRQSAEEQKKMRDKRLKSIDQFWEDARAYLKLKDAGMLTETSVRFDAMTKFIKGEAPVFIHANDISQIQAALDWGKKQKIRLVIVGGYDAWRIADELKNANVPVVYQNVHSLPVRRWEAYDTPFTIPAKLHKAGVTFCIAPSEGVWDAGHTRSLPYEAATAAAYGLPKEEALKALTLYPAKILGVDDRLGDVVVGKDATIIITNGDPLEITTNIEMMFIEGRKIDLRSRHTELYEKYREKYRQLKMLNE